MKDRGFNLNLLNDAIMSASLFSWLACDVVVYSMALYKLISKLHGLPIATWSQGVVYRLITH